MPEVSGYFPAVFIGYFLKAVAYLVYQAKLSNGVRENSFDGGGEP